MSQKNLTGLAGGVREGQNMAQNGSRLKAYMQNFWLWSPLEVRNESRTPEKDSNQLGGHVGSILDYFSFFRFARTSCTTSGDPPACLYAEKSWTPIYRHICLMNHQETHQINQEQSSTVQYSQVDPNTAKYSPVQLSIAKYSLLQPSTVHYSQVQASTAQESPLQPSRVQCSPVQPSIAQSFNVQWCSIVLKSLQKCSKVFNGVQKCSIVFKSV